MHSEEPSQTARTAAAARAAHLIVDRSPWIFSDTVAGRLLGDQAEELLGYHRRSGDHPVLAGARAQVVSRSRYTETRLADLVHGRPHPDPTGRDTTGRDTVHPDTTGRGIDQYVVLAAGLDSFALRAADVVPPDKVPRVFEVDRPGTQAWKLRRLRAAGSDLPPHLRQVPVDLETEPLLEALTAAGFDPDRPALVSWLGSTVYLTTDAIERTAAVVGSLAPGSELILDYLLPPELRDAAGRWYAEQVGAVAAEHGEPWLSWFAPEDLTALLGRAGLTVLRHLDQRAAVPERFWDRTDSLRPSRLQCLAHAAVPVPVGAR